MMITIATSVIMDFRTSMLFIHTVVSEIIRSFIFLTVFDLIKTEYLCHPFALSQY